MTTEYRTDHAVSGGTATIRWGADDERGHVVWATGDVDLANADGLLDAVAAHLACAGPPELVIDLSGVTFMDSTGFHRLFTAMCRLEAAGRGLTLRNPSVPVRRLLDLLHATQVFHIE
jgi:anti-sigma B factor antagonist